MPQTPFSGPPANAARIALAILRHPAILLLGGAATLLVGLIGWSMLVNDVGLQLGLAAQTRAAIGQTSWACIALLLYAAYVRFAEGRRDAPELGRRGLGGELALGTGVGVAAMSLTILAIAIGGGYSVARFNAPSLLLGHAVAALFAGVWEELLFRGFLFRLVEQWLGTTVALLASAALFGAAHLGNDNASPLAAFAIAIEAGILLGAVYMLTRRLWAAIGLHMAWNFTQGGVFGVAVSGFTEPGLIIPHISGPALLTGGAFGAEASMPAMVICTAIGVYCLWLAWARGEWVSPSVGRLLGRIRTDG